MTLCTFSASILFLYSGTPFVCACLDFHLLPCVEPTLVGITYLSQMDVRGNTLGPCGVNTGRNNLPLTNGEEILVYPTLYKNIDKSKNVINNNYKK